ncbi:MAG: carboxypeptidase regulatory-like domain-containing protein [Alistipes sp.]|nr:carboxypeptidase regulatory-like domain-containing protein [Alistipes sp.]
MKRLILAACVLMMGACAKDIVKLTGDIKGVVKDYDNRRLIENCEITITPGGYSTVTNSNGVWEYTDLEPGEYTLTYRKAGYYDESRKTTIITGQVTNVDVLLRAKSPFDLSETYYDFGDYTTEHTFTCFNNSDGVCNYEVKNIPTWITCNKRSGSVYAGSSDTFRLSVDRNKLTEGEHRHTLTIKYSGNNSGEIALDIVVMKVKLTTPTVSISETAKEIGKDSFKIEGRIEAMGGAQISEHGFYWGTSESNMTNHNNLGVMRETGSFQHTITGLNYNTTYYVKAYARNSQGIAYSKVVSVTTQDMASNTWDGSTASSFAGGKGTSASPYLIETGAQLVLMKQYSSSCFKLMQNINLNNRAWPSFDFSGTLDGNGFVISNLKVTKSGDNIGFFATLKGTVKNLTISGVNIDTTGNYVDAIAGWLQGTNSSGAITNCTVQLNKDSFISGNDYVGGVVGFANGNFSMVTRCSVNGVSTTNQIIGNNYVGGIVGYFYHYATPSPMEDCSVSANIAGTDRVGGLIGYSSIGGSVGDDGFYIKKSSFVGELSANSIVAGIVGDCTPNTIIAGCKADVKINVEDNYAAGIASSSSTLFMANIIGSYAVGEIVCTKGNANAVGGLVATYHGVDATIDSCYSMVLCNSTNFSGLCGCEGSGSHWNCYYSGIINCASIMPEVHNVDYCTSTSNNFSEFLQSCYSAYAGYWNFDKTWTWSGKVNGQNRTVTCPRLAWE